MSLSSRQACRLVERPQRRKMRPNGSANQRTSGCSSSGVGLQRCHRRCVGGERTAGYRSACRRSRLSIASASSRPLTPTRTSSLDEVDGLRRLVACRSWPGRRRSCSVVPPTCDFRFTPPRAASRFSTRPGSPSPAASRPVTSIVIASDGFLPGRSMIAKLSSPAATPSRSSQTDAEPIRYGRRTCRRSASRGSRRRRPSPRR